MVNILLKTFLILLCSVNYSLADSLERSEIKAGLLKHSVKSRLRHTYEKGYDFNMEYLFSAPQFLKPIFSPRPHIGAHLNSNRATSIAYAGLTWGGTFYRNLFIEISLGGCVHNGNLKNKSSKKTALGSRFLFRESISLGAKFNDRESISLILDHASNAKLAKPNPGLTNFGIRYGIEF